MVPMPLITSTLLFLFAFILLWIGSGLAVSAITKISHSLRMSSFFVSFFVMGLFTSLTEIMVGINAVIDKQPEIFIGNLIGSSVVVFLLVVPLLAVLGNGVKLNHSFKFKDLVTATLVVGLPAFLSIDGRISFVDVWLCIIFYAYFVYIQERNTGSIGRLLTIDLGKSTIYVSLAKVLGAIVLVFFASDILVSQTKQLGEILRVSPFIISILVISIGTNIPELSIAVRSILAKKKDIAFGNYLGSASLNTFELGILGLFSNKPIPANGSNYSILMFLVGLLLFLVAGKRKSDISRNEGVILLVIYGLFVLLEIFTGPDWRF